MRAYFAAAAICAALATSTSAHACNVQIGYADSCNVYCFDTGEMIGNPYNPQGIQIAPTCAQRAAQRQRAQQQPSFGHPDVLRKIEAQSKGGGPQPTQGPTTAQRPTPNAGLPAECRAFPAMCSAYK